MENRTLITGNTYPVKDQIKALGARWDAAAKGWWVPNESAEEAQRLVSGTKRSPEALRAAVTAPRAEARSKPRGVYVACGYPGCGLGYCDDCDRTNRGQSVVGSH